MTNKDAIHILELMAIDMTGALAGLNKTNPLLDVLDQRLQAIDRAQSALQFQEQYLKSLTGGHYA